MSTVKIGIYIRKQRKAANLNQRELAERIGFKTPNAISMIELGKTLFPIARTRDFIDALGMSEEKFAIIVQKNHPKLKSTPFELGNKSLPVPTIVDERTQIFNFKGNDLTTIINGDGNPWWVAKEVCGVLGMKHVGSALRHLDSDEKDVLTMHTPGGMQEVTIINEPGLYSLILRSRKPTAKEFKRWVTHEVLPTLRKTGRYEVKPSAPELTISQAQKQILDNFNQFSNKWVETQRRLMDKLCATRKNLKEANEQISELQAHIEAGVRLTPEEREKIRSWDQFCAKRRGYSYTDSAHMLEIRPSDFIYFIKQKKFVNRHGLPLSKGITPGYFRLRTKKDPDRGVYYKDGIVTPKGLAYFSKIIADGKFIIKSEKF